MGSIRYRRYKPSTHRLMDVMVRVRVGGNNSGRRKGKS